MKLHANVRLSVKGRERFGALLDYEQHLALHHR